VRCWQSSAPCSDGGRYRSGDLIQCSSAVQLSSAAQQCGPALTEKAI
jgi:hypothetical protein